MNTGADTRRAGPFPGGQGLKAALFDFDGTLTVATLDFLLMRQRALEALAPFSGESFRSGAMIVEEIERVTAGLSTGEAARATRAAYAAIEEVELEAAGRSSLLPFVRPMLIALTERRIAIAIITRNFPAAVFKVFPDLSSFTACILTRNDVAQVKPHPAHLEAALELLNIPPEQALMVGDHPSDIQAGKRANTRTAGVASGESAAETLALEEPDYLAADAGELMQRLGIL